MEHTKRRMLGVICGLLGLLTLPATSIAQGDVGAATPVQYSVTYIDVALASRSAAVTALSRYRDASSREPGYVGVEVLEQAGRSARFVIVETWKDAAAFSAHVAAPARVTLIAALQPIRTSPYDERTYLPLTIGTARAKPRTAVRVVTQVDILPPFRDEGQSVLKEWAAASRSDAGNLQFDVVENERTRPGHFTVLEVWEDQSALAMHAASMHMKQKREQLKTRTGGPIDERLYTPLP